MWPVILFGATIAVVLAISRSARAGRVTIPTAPPPVRPTYEKLPEIMPPDYPEREELPEIMPPDYPKRGPTADEAKFVSDVLKAARNGNATVDMLSKAIAIAKKWFPAIVAELEALLQALVAEKFRLAQETDKKPEQPKGIVKSPFEKITNEKWSRFVKAAGTGKVNTVSPGWHLGIFYHGARRLDDLGYMTNVRQEDYKGRKVWKGDFIEPVTLESFLSDPVIQYEMFKHDMSNHYPFVISRYKSYLGKKIEGEKVTLSGLLILAKAAGLRGAGLWLKNPADRIKYTHTTNAFKRANGIF